MQNGEGKMKQIAKATHLFIASGIVFLTLLIPIIASAEGTSPLTPVQKPVYCGDATKLLNFLTEKHKEVPIIIFNEENGTQSQVIIFVNVEKGTASVVENMPSGYGCLIASGFDLMIVPVKEDSGT